MRVDPRWKVRGWALKKKLDEEGEEERKRKETGEAKTGHTLGEVWHSRASTMPLGEAVFGWRPVLDDDSTVRDLEDDIEWLQDTSSTCSTIIRRS